MADYVLEGVKWQHSNNVVTWSIAGTNYADRSVQFSSFVPPQFTPDIQSAFDRWSSVANINFVQVQDSDSANIRLGFNEIDGPEGVAGYSHYQYNDSSIFPHPLDHSDIEFDSSENWTRSFGHQVLQDIHPFYAIALHEIGHSLGLDHYNEAPAIMNASNVGVDDLQVPDIDGAQAIYGAPLSPSFYTLSDNGNGTHDLTLLASDHTVFSIANDTFYNNGQSNTRFFLQPGFNYDAIQDFVVGGLGHSIIDLPHSDFANIADVLRHTHNTAIGAVIDDPSSGDSLQISGVSKAALVHHKTDFALHL